MMMDGDLVSSLYVLFCFLSGVISKKQIILLVGGLLMDDDESTYDDGGLLDEDCLVAVPLDPSTMTGQAARRPPNNIEDMSGRCVFVPPLAGGAFG